MEGLETRELLTYSVIGTSLPILTISGYGSPAASWGGPLTINANVANIGASTIREPLALAAGSTSSADAPASVIGVFASTNPHNFKNAIEVGTINVPALPQNSAQQISDTITLPKKPANFPGDGGKIYIELETNATNTVFQADSFHQVSKPFLVQIEAPLPELVAVGLDLPPVMQPDDTISPTIRIANIGPADTSPQGPVTVALVASTTKSFTSGSSIVATFTIDNIPGVSKIATIGTLPTLGDANQNPPLNVVTVSHSPVTLPVSPKTYFLGLVIDPTNQIKQLSKVAALHAKAANNFVLIRTVGPPIKNLPPAHVLVNGGTTLIPTFPIPFNGVPVGGPLGGTFPVPGSGNPVPTPVSPPAVPIAPI